jgi:Flp pilus assembly pilin Flp
LRFAGVPFKGWLDAIPPGGEFSDMDTDKRLRNDQSSPGEYSMIERLANFYVRTKESGKALTRGQTMSEYALILAAVALVVFVFYQTMGQSIDNMVEWGTIHNDLLSS